VYLNGSADDRRVASVPDSSTPQGQHTRQRLLAATRAVLEEEGFAALTMGKVAARAQVTRKTVYLHFGTRGALIAELFGYVAAAEGLHRSLAPVWSAPDGAAALEEWAHHLARYHPQLLAVGRALQQVWRSDPDAAAHHRRILAAKHGNCRRLAQRLADEGILAPGWTVQSAADMLNALATTDLIEALAVDRGWSHRALADGLARLFRSAFLTASYHPGRRPR